MAMAWRFLLVSLHTPFLSPRLQAPCRIGVNLDIICPWEKQQLSQRQLVIHNKFWKNIS